MYDTLLELLCNLVFKNGISPKIWAVFQSSMKTIWTAFASISERYSDAKVARVVFRTAVKSRQSLRSYIRPCFECNIN